VCFTDAVSRNALTSKVTNDDDVENFKSWLKFGHQLAVPAAATMAA